MKFDDTPVRELDALRGETPACVLVDDQALRDVVRYRDEQREDARLEVDEWTWQPWLSARARNRT